MLDEIMPEQPMICWLGNYQKAFFTCHLSSEKAHGFYWIMLVEFF